MYPTSNPALEFDFAEYNGSRSVHQVSIINKGNACKITGIKITSNAVIDSPWGLVGEHWHNCKITKDATNNVFTYNLTAEIPLVLGSNSLIYYNIGDCLGPLAKIPMPPKKIEVCLDGKWQGLPFYNIKPAPEEKQALKMYHTNWGQYTHKRFMDNESWSSINYLTYAFVGFNESGEVFSLDTWAENLELPMLAKHKRQNPTLKTTIAFGGWTNAGKRMDTVFSAMAADPDARTRFVKAAVAAAREVEANGIDIDWEYAKEKDAANFVSLMQELRAELNQYIPNALLTIAAPAGPDKISVLNETQWQQIAAVITDFGVMTYDYYGDWDKCFDFHAPWESDKQTAGKMSIVSTLQDYAKQGIPINKIELGIPAYTRAVIVKEPGARAGLGQPIIGAAPGAENGMYTWDDINKLLKKQASALDVLGVKQWFFYDSDHPFCQKAGMCLLTGALPDGNWVVMSFLDQKATRQRAEKFKKMGGSKTMIWANDCEPLQEAETIAKAVADGMRGNLVTYTTEAEIKSVIPEVRHLNVVEKLEVYRAELYSKTWQWLPQLPKSKADILEALKTRSMNMRDESILATHRDAFKRLINAIITFFGFAPIRTKSYQIAKELMDTKQMMEAAMPPTKIINPRQADMLLWQKPVPSAPEIATSNMRAFATAIPIVTATPQIPIVVATPVSSITMTQSN